MDLFKVILLLNYSFTMALPVHIELMKSKNIRNAVLIDCKNLIDAQKNLIKYDIRSSYFFTNSTDLPNLGYSKVAYILNTSCESWDQVFNVTDVRFFGGFYTWLIYTDNLSTTVDVLSKYPVDIHSDFIIITKKQDIFYLYEVYNKGFYTNGSFIVADLGYYDSQLYLRANSRTDLTGVVMKCVVVVVDPIVNQTLEHFLDKKTPGEIVDTVHKLKFYTLIKYIQKMYNFR